MSAYVYMLRCANGALYTGWTNDLVHRLAMHRSGAGAKYTRAFKAVDMVYYEELPDKSAAMQREYALKQLAKKQKEELVRRFSRNPLKKVEAS